MGKSIRSKREKRLRTLKREIVEPHYDVKDQAKLAVQDAALAAPKIELPPRRPESDDTKSRGRTGTRDEVAMSIDAENAMTTGSKLRPTGGIGKRGKSKKKYLSRKHKKNKF